MIDLQKCKVRWDKEKYIPKKVYDFETEPKKGTPRRIAEIFLKENLKSLKISASVEDLRYERTINSLGAKTVLFQQFFKNTPIHGAWFAVHMDKQNKIFMVKNDLVPVPKLKKELDKVKGTFLPVSKIDAIVKKKIKEYGVLNSRIKKEDMIYTLRGFVKRVWKVKFITRNPAASWILFIDRTSGDIIDERNVLKEITGRGKVFRPNPIVSLDRDDLLDKKDKDQKIFENAYRYVDLKGLNSEGCLKGSYVDTTITSNYAKSSDHKFFCTRENNIFEEVMAYYHIDRFQRYIQSLGFKGNKGILDYPIKVNVHGGYEDNASYISSAGIQKIILGDGGVDDAEDAEVIVHEYGHAIQDTIVPGFGQSHEGESMGEGFSDYVAGSFFCKYKKKSRKVKLAEWDAKGYVGGPYECLRRLDSNKHYPEDMEEEEHSDGEIWSACLWKIRKLLGKKKADTVILESHFYLNQYSDFKDGAEAIIMAKKNLYGDKKTKALNKIFQERGIL